ncbi:MAG TPA: hypothetical protein H9836_16500 [Candidatus Nocardiopsis merdipullorum]|nr:hypothetical protein [Candidatus Nocardiopsis merdipullorum]
MTANVVAQSVPKPHREKTEEILAAFVDEGVVTVDEGGKYVKVREAA